MAFFFALAVNRPKRDNRPRHLESFRRVSDQTFESSRWPSKKVFTDDGTPRHARAAAAAARSLLGLGRRGGRRRREPRGYLERVHQASRAPRAGPHRPEAVASTSIGRIRGWGSRASARASTPAARGSRRDARRLGHALGPRRRPRGQVPQTRRGRGRDDGQVGGGHLHVHSLHRADLPRRGSERLPDDGPAYPGATRGPRVPRQHVDVGGTRRRQLPRREQRGRRRTQRLVRLAAVVQSHLPRVQQPGCPIPIANHQRRAPHRTRGFRTLPLRHTARYKDTQALQRTAGFSKGVQRGRHRRERDARVHRVCGGGRHRTDRGDRRGV